MTQFHRRSPMFGYAAELLLYNDSIRTYIQFLLGLWLLFIFWRSTLSLVMEDVQEFSDVAIRLACIGCRTTWNIVWSCLVAIFLCTWVAVHPNVPGPDDKWPVIALRRVKVMVLVLIAPEIVIVWAMRQWLKARQIAQEYQRHRWTTTHGFLAVMGGFMLFSPNEPPRILTPDELGPLLESGEINITAEEVEDRSKGDILSKGLVIIQTGWIILQCVARRIQHLPITELELVTLAFATLNFVTYRLWWNKPLNVRRPIPVRRSQISVTGNETRNETEINVQFEFTAFIRAAPAATGRAAIAAMEHVRDKGVLVVIGNCVFTAIVYIMAPFFEIAGVFGPLSKFPDVEWGWGTSGQNTAQKVPEFYSGELSKKDERLAKVVGLFAAVIFGMIHCLAWSFSFPSYNEQLLWRIGSLAETCLPLFWFLLGEFINSNKVEYFSGDPSLFFMIIVNILIPLLYVIGRVIVLVIAFTSLRALSADAYQTVRWTTFIPHI